MPFVHQVTARFFEVDRAGILFFGRVFEFCHCAYEELLMAAGGDIDRLFEQDDCGMPLVHAEADFSRPIRMHDRVDVELSVERLSERSVTFGYILRGQDGEVRAKAKLVHAFIRLSDFTPGAAPTWLIEGLRALELIE